MGNGIHGCLWGMEFWGILIENYREAHGKWNLWMQILEIDFNVRKVGKRDECMEVPVESHGNVIFSVRINVDPIVSLIPC